MNPLVHFCRALEARLFPGRVGRRRRRDWEANWRRPDFAPAWAGRGIASEIVQSARSGWFPPAGRVLDIGCGLAEIAAWFSERGYSASGIDIADAAVVKARAMHRHMPSAPTLFTHDICAAPPPGGPYDILIDRGCLHQIPSGSVARYVRHIAAVSASDARMMLFMRAFRNGRAIGDADETKRLAEWVTGTFDGIFDMQHVALTYLDRYKGKNPSNVLPGLVFHLTKA